MYLEGGNLLRITESELLRFGLCIGLDIDDRTVVELQQSGARSETRVRAAIAQISENATEFDYEE